MIATQSRLAGTWRPLVFLVGAASSLLWMAAAGCGSSNAAGTPGKDAPSTAKPVAVAIVSPQTRDVSRLIELPADVQPAQEAVVYAKTAGYLDRILVDKGDVVKKGQLLAVIQAPELRAEKAQAESNFASEQSRARGGIESHSASIEAEGRAQSGARKARAEFDQAPANTKKAQALVAEARAQIAQAASGEVQAGAAADAAAAEVVRATAELRAARSERALAEATYRRYRSIYDRDAQLIALQDVETAQAAAEAARDKAAVAESGLTVAQKRVQQAQAQRSIARSASARASAQLTSALADLDLARAGERALRAQVGVADRDVAIAQRRRREAADLADEAKNRAAAAGSASEKANALSGYANLIAPFDGTVTRRFVDAGAFIQTAAGTQSAASIVTLADLRSVRIYLNIPEAEASLVRNGTSLFIKLSTGSKEILSATVTRTSSALDPKTRSLLAEADVPNPKGAILTGAYATVRVVLETHRGVVSLPSKAVGSDKSGRFVWLVVNGAAKRLAVQTGFDDGEFVEVKSGLKGNEQVAAEKLDTLTPGAAIAPSATKADGLPR
ncbi:MAG TPA: efflux RND transporter periplasmic adaptor subunit [Fimbriimonadaceae bacterium]|nr:efflux RND transporter periplasmic adaptor subunit [Fimbriimonadaceae bacterium]